MEKQIKELKKKITNTPFVSIFKHYLDLKFVCEYKHFFKLLNLHIFKNIEIFLMVKIRGLRIY